MGNRLLFLHCLSGRMGNRARLFATKLSINRRCFLAVTHAPETRMLGDNVWSKKANERSLQQQHHNDVARNAQRQRKAEALNACRSQEEQGEGRNQRNQVGIDRGFDAMTNTRDGGRTNASAHSDFLAETLKYQNRGVGSHTDGKDDTRNARQRKREQAERRKRSQKAKVEHGEHGHSSSSEQAQTVIEEQQVQHNQGKTQNGNDQTAVEGILTKRRTYHLALLVVEAYRQ